MPTEPTRNESVLFAPIAREIVERVRTGLLRVTPAELEVLRQLMAGSSSTEMSAALGISGPTLQSHVGRIYEKTGSTRSELMRCVFELRDDAELLAHLEGLPNKVRRGGARRKGDDQARFKSPRLVRMLRTKSP